jgi:hypothetical protein
MKDNQNNQINFQSSLVNSEIGEKLAKFKFLSDFLSNFILYYYQIKYSSRNFTQEELDIAKDKSSQLKDIINETIDLFQKDLDKK